MNTLYVVGLGPGAEQFLTGQAREALERAQVLCGYTVYVDLVAPLFPEKETYTSPMKKELDRCRWAMETAQNGKDVALVCSGDAGVYGMAGLLLQLSPQYPGVEIQVVAGVTAALSGGAVLGAPLGHDFCVISLSDLLTPWEVIEKRLRCAAWGDFCLCLYNPSSHKRVDWPRPATSCWQRGNPRIPCAVGCGTLAGKARAHRCSLSKSCGMLSWICLLPCSSVLPLPRRFPDGW